MPLMTKAGCCSAGWTKTALSVLTIRTATALKKAPTCLLYTSEDATAPARILANFAKTAPKLELKASVVEGTYYDQAGTQVIATIPSREELLGKLLGSIQSPITNLARVLNQIAEQQGGAAEA